jgi:hypothetical protein
VYIGRYLMGAVVSGLSDRAFAGAEATLSVVLRKARLWEEHAGESFNDMHRMAVNRVLEGVGSTTRSARAPTTRTRPTRGKDKPVRSG